MNVRCIGGPRAGQLINIVEGRKWLVVPKDPPRKLVAFDQIKAPSNNNTFDTVTYVVEKLHFGSDNELLFYAIPEGDSFIDAISESWAGYSELQKLKAKDNDRGESH